MTRLRASMLGAQNGHHDEWLYMHDEKDYEPERHTRNRPRVSLWAQQQEKDHGHRGMKDRDHVPPEDDDQQVTENTLPRDIGQGDMDMKYDHTDIDSQVEAAAQHRGGWHEAQPDRLEAEWELGAMWTDMDDGDPDWDLRKPMQYTCEDKVMSKDLNDKGMPEQKYRGGMHHPECLGDDEIRDTQHARAHEDDQQHSVLSHNRQ